MIIYQNTGNIHITKRYGKQVDIEKINLQIYNKVMGVWKIYTRIHNQTDNRLSKEDTRM